MALDACQELTILIPARDEEANLPATLARLSGLAATVVVVDSGTAVR